MDRRQWICTALDTPGGARVAGSPTVPEKMGVADKTKLWKKGTKLGVRFIGGTPELHARVLSTARAWLEPGVKLDLVAAEGQPAQIRVAFNPKTGSWSYVGTDCLGILPGEPTMNLGWAGLDTPEEDFSSVVIHEFGHAFGLLHEHNHPDAKINWNKTAVYDDLRGDPNYWDDTTIESNVFAKFDQASVVTTPFDQVSVMIYTVPKHWTTDGKGFMPSWKLSKGDAATIKSLYG
jgi:serralysin